VSGRHVRVAGERFDVQRLRVLPVDPVADAAQPREIAQVLLRGGSAGHLRDRATPQGPPVEPLEQLKSGLVDWAAVGARLPEQGIVLVGGGADESPESIFSNGREHARAAEPVDVEPAGVDDARDATRRTRLANERTYLAWWRTGLTTFAVSLAAGKLVPELSSGAAWPFEAIGVAFAVVGLLFIVYAYVRQKRVEDALARGEYAPFETRVALVFAALGVALGVGTIVVVLVQPG
jgi:putative membrane protein